MRVFVVRSPVRLRLVLYGFFWGVCSGFRVLLTCVVVCWGLFGVWTIRDLREAFGKVAG